MFYSMFQHSNFSFHPFSATPARSSPQKGAIVSRPVVGLECVNRLRSREIMRTRSAWCRHNLEFGIDTK